MTKRKVPSPKPWWEVHAAKLILASAGIAAFLALLSIAKPILESRLPTASQDDVKAVEKSASEQVKILFKQVEQLDVRQSQSIARGASVAGTLRSLRIQQLRAEMDRLKDAKDEASRTLLIRDQAELDAMIQEQNVAPMP